jgi:hypothetical protein
MAPESEEVMDDLLVIEDLDVGDESELRRVVAEIESLVGVTGRGGLRVSVLTTEQWKTVVKRMVPPTLRRGAELYYFMLRDPRDPRHLLVSPSAVRGINEGNRQMYQELVYTTLRCVPTDLTSSLRKGLDDVLAEACAERIGVDLYVRTYPRQSDLVRALLGVLINDFGYGLLDWATIFRRTPKRVFLAFKESKFMVFWEEYMRETAGVSDPDRAALLEALNADPLRFESPLIATTEQAITAYLIQTKGKQR